ncbi:hypothetical protein [Candidatus Nanohalobium constans]|uniref:Uncharacterized protein n=1 Tax=Candidatus Nanohalobium constans TaxID=2565781 RepID=A0A5Q0UHE1_9ARCH|nr:hypothetical protein [Candidatus Nanohalobium constans]QGA81004.1 hypothetical protein LC1Nh_1136 [Candidatus Nanohalobium constans]
MRAKGQVFTPDFVASVAIFSFFLLIFAVIWNTSMEMFLDDQNEVEVQHDYTFSLLKTDGAPQNWNSTNVTVPGLYQEGYLSAEKVLELRDVSLERQRQVMKAQEFYLGVYTLNGSLANHEGRPLEVFIGSEDGDRYPDNSTVYVSKQISVLEENRERAELRYYTWQ